MKRYNNQPLITMFIAALIVTIISVLFVALSVGYYVSDMVERQQTRKLEVISADFDAFFERGVFFAEMIAYQVSSQFDMSKYHEGSNSVHHIKDNLDDMMQDYIQGKGVEAMYFVFNPELIDGSDSVITLATQMHEGYDMFPKLNEMSFLEKEEENTWFFDAIESEEGIWVAPFYNLSDTKEVVFYYNKAVYKDDQLIGVAVVQYDRKHLEEIVSRHSSDNDGHIWVFDDEEHILYHPLNMNYNNLSDYYGYIDVASVPAGGSESYDGRLSETIKVHRFENGWIVGITFFNTFLQEKLHAIIKVTLFTLVLAIITLSLLAYCISIKISDKLLTLNTEVMKIESGNKEDNISAQLMSEKNEIGDLATSIHRLIDTKRRSNKEIRKQRDEIINLYEETYAINTDLENTLFQKEELYSDLNIMFKRLEDANKALEDRVYQRTLELNENNKALESALRENKNNNRDLRKLNKELKKSLKDLTLAQERLIESEKMVALGNMVSGIAHEINTPLGVSLTATSYILEQFEEMRSSIVAMSDDELNRLLEDIEESNKIVFEALKRSIELVSSFKEVAVNQNSNEKIVFNLLDYTNTITRSLQHEYRDVVSELTIDIPMGIEVYNYPGAYSQIITNLILNSVKHGFEGRSDGSIVIMAYEEDERVKLIFSDNGIGISKTNLKKIFEPFFTTKRTAGGTGLGLSVVYNLVKTTMKGDITCSSTLEHGTQFNIEFPINIDYAQE